LFERLAHPVPRFDKTVQKFCQDIAERRNAELHSADLPFRAMRLEAWEARYWHACDTILHQMGSSLEQWLGAADAKAPRRLLDEAANALDAAVKLRVEAAKEQFAALKKSERERLATEAELREPQHQVALFSASSKNTLSRDRTITSASSIGWLRCSSDPTLLSPLIVCSAA
jgi:exonuclease VII large subunit